MPTPHPPRAWSSLKAVAETLAVRCRRCGDPFAIVLTSARHPDYCEECRALLDEQLTPAERAQDAHR